jgi:acyl transferase domain-containing protein/acyl carrier protein
MKDALLELKQLRATVNDLKRARTEPIAIIGMSCRMPGGVDGPDSYWELLRNGVDAISEVPADRWDAATYYDPNPDAPGKIATCFGGFLQDRIDGFDPAFFGISPLEARSLDPQQRLLLEVTWEALERAGQSPADLYGSPTGVFIGMSTFDYALHQVGGAVDEEDLRRLDGYVATGSTMSPAAGRLSYVLGLNGPSMVVDTACSSSLVATHLAVNSLRNRECDMALVGGVNVILRPEWNVNFTKAHMLAPDGRCKTFDASADGYSRGEGCGIVVLQRLSDALTARRSIVALVRSSAVNQDGASGGLTVPSGPSQEQVIRRALDEAGIAPGEVSYVEAHGTGTSLGDPIEVAALGSVFGAGRAESDPLRIGSVKTNIGHLEAAAGVAGLMKVALSLRHEEIPPHLHYRNGNPMIDWDGLPIVVPVERTPWPSSLTADGGAPRRASLSSFGFTGTNAHIVLEEAPVDTAARAADAGTTAAGDRPVHVLTLSARTPEALEQLAARYERYFADHPDVAMPDVAFTTNTGRAPFRHRLALVAASTADAQKMLAAHAAGTPAAAVCMGQAAGKPTLAFLFTGQGSQYAGMGRQLYDTEPVFRSAMDRCDEILRDHLERPLLEVVYPAPGQQSPIDDTMYTQPALFALEYALATLWKSWGIEPDAVMGHSVGEYVAACVAGVFSLEDGLRLIAARARLMQSLQQSGQMAAVQTTSDRAAAAIASHASEVSLAALNGPSSVVISGAAHAVSSVLASLEADGVRAQALRVSHAFHSPLMEPMLADFERVAKGITYTPPAKAIVSNVTGLLAGPKMATPGYWVRHVREAVRFADGMTTLYAQGVRTFVEIGPSSTLLGMGRLSVTDPATAWLPSLRPDGDSERILMSLAELHANGANVDWSAFHRGRARRPVELPTYPFQRQRYWIDITRRRRAPEPGEAQPLPLETHVAEPVTQPAAHLYEIAWRTRPHSAEEQVPTSAGHWVILGGEGPLGRVLAGELRAHRARCTIVSAGDGFARLSDGQFTVDPGNAADLEQLWASIPSEDAVRGVVHLWGLDSSPAEDPSDSRVDGLESVLRMVQAVVKAGRPSPPAMWCITRGAVAAGPDAAPLALAQSLQWGLGRVVSLEQPGIWGGLVDLDARGSDEADARALARELLSPGGEDQVALRGDSRYVPRLVRLTPEAAAVTPLDPKGTYLVLGGLGALGLHAARWLVSRGARTLVLASRRGMASPGADEAARALKALGADRVVVERADASSADDLDALLADIAATAAPLRGIVHAAGIDAPVALTDMTSDDLRTMLSSKVRGGWLLHERTRHLPLDLFVCFSSVSAVWGAPGRAHYAAANAFLDALAHERRRQGLPALSVNWGPWLGGGLASEDDLRQLATSGLRGLEPDAALRSLDAVAAGGCTQAVVADLDWPRFRAAFEARRRRPLLAELPEERGAAPTVEGRTADWIERLRRLPPGGRASALEALVRGEVAGTLGYASPDEVPLDQSVFELGMDSLRAVELAMRLQRHLGIERPIQFFDSPQVTALAARLLDEVAPSILPAHEQPARPADTTAPASAKGDGVVRYSPEREAEIFEFSRIAWPTRPDHLIESRWRWMFVESARRVGREPQVWLYRDRGRVVGHHGAMPVRLEAGGEVFDSAWFADTMVLEGHRSSAVGARLVIESNDEFAVGLSLGQTEKMRKIAVQLGWHQVAPLQTFVLLLRPRRVLGDKLHPIAAGALGSGLRARQSLKRLFAGRKDEQLDIRPIDAFGGAHDRLWASVREHYRCAVTRDASYLNWKYVTQPGQDFVRLEFGRNGEVVAVAILAIDDPGVIYQYRRALIVDLVVSPADRALVLGVLDAIRRECAAREVDAVTLHLMGEQLEETVQAYGFLRREPTRFLLVSPQRVPAHARGPLLSPEQWLITMGDSDIDRPWEVDGGRIQTRTHLTNHDANEHQRMSHANGASRRSGERESV